ALEFLAAMLVAQGQILDRIAVTVDDIVITESEVIRNLRVEAFLDKKPVDLNSAAKRAEAERLVNQSLLFQEAANYRVTLPGPEAAAGQVSLVKADFAGEEAYSAALRRYQIREKDVSDYQLAAVRALVFTDIRFRPDVQVPEEESRDKALVEQRVTDAMDR